MSAWRITSLLCERAPVPTWSSLSTTNDLRAIARQGPSHREPKDADADHETLDRFHRGRPPSSAAETDRLVSIGQLATFAQRFGLSISVSNSTYSALSAMCFPCPNVFELARFIPNGLQYSLCSRRRTSRARPAWPQNSLESFWVTRDFFTVQKLRGVR